MKNKKILVIISTILMVCLVAGMGAMTYSRYISTTTLPTQTATAAKWGYVITADVQNIFASDYKKDGANATASVNGSGAIVVNGKDDALVVAPGTHGSMSITVSGSSEVMAKLTFDLTITSDIQYDGYYPVKWTLTKDGVAVDGCQGVTLAALKAALVDFNDDNEAIAPGATVTGAYELSWAWALEVDNETNVKDTLIGYKAVEPSTEWAAIKDIKCATGATYAEFTGDDGAKYNDIETEISFTLSVTLEQVQGN